MWWLKLVVQLLELSSVLWHCYDVWLDRATVMHKLSDTYATYCQWSWHRHWRAAWYWRGWTTAIHCFLAHILAVSRHYSACRTTPPGLFCNHRGGATQTRCCASSTGCLFVTESTTTSWLWWLTRSTAQVYLHTWVITSTLAKQHEHCVHLTLYCSPRQSPGLSSRRACLPMRSSICLELTTFNHHQQQLSDDPKISAKNLFFPFIFWL